MTPAALAGYLIVPLLGAAVAAGPAITRPTVQFGVRVPPGHTGAPVIRQTRSAFIWRTSVIAAVATAAAFGSWGHGSWWLARIILGLELVADLVCFELARRRLRAVKATEAWFAGQRQTVVADTSWRTDPPRFPVWWLVPALAVIAATVVGRLTAGHPPARTPLAGYAPVLAQLWVTGLWTGLLLLVYRSRPELDTADPARSLQRYRALLGTITRAALTFLALIDAGLLLAALRQWRVFGLDGAARWLLVLPFAAGLAFFLVVWFRAGRTWVTAGGRRGGADRDDDRFWKGGLLYVNHNDPAVMVAARFGIGWTLNFGNRAAWLLVGSVAGIPAGLIVLRFTAGL
jgi:uncharacterized membrane protein